MSAWSFIGVMFLLPHTPPTGDPVAPTVAKAPVPIADISQHRSYRLQPVRAIMPPDAPIDPSMPQRRFARQFAAVPYQIRDPQGDAVRTLLRDRAARRGGPLDARVEMRLTADHGDFGLGGGLKRVFDTLRRD